MTPLRRLAPILALLACGGVQLRPDGSPAEEPCPAGAAAAMRSFGLVPAEGGRLGSGEMIELDVTQRRDGPMVIYDGPIESELSLNMVYLPERTRLQGRVWTGGPRAVIRYYSARLPDGRQIPFCAVVGENGPGLPKASGRPGSAALARIYARVYVVSRFR